MRIFLLGILILISISLIVLIMLQVRGGGAGTVFGGGTEVYRSRRGAEKLFHYATIFLAVLYASVSLALIFVT